MKNNYRIDVFYRCKHHKIEFPEHWLAVTAGRAIARDEETSVYLLERISDNSFDVVKQL